MWQRQIGRWIFLALCLGGSAAHAQSACSESPTGQQNCEVYAARDQNPLSLANVLRSRANASGVTIPAAPSNFCELIDVDNSSTEDWQFRCHTRSGSALTVHLDELVTTGNTATLTNKTYDAEGTGNTLTTVERRWLRAAQCNNASAVLLWDTPTANAAAAACVTGSNTQKGVLDFDDTTDESIQQTVLLPTDWTGAIDARLDWLAAATSGAVGWCVQLVCVAAGETDDPAFPAQASGNCVSSTAAGSTLQTTIATKTGLTATSCAAGELMHVQVSRDANGGAVTDDMTGDARLIGVELTFRRAQ
ncbi:MAG: hypothetical protein SF182_01665 [Deltaproteobacteria bacterium]|nr:hypothetical protein [Deltaproteobacteria bacterium]